MESLISAVRLVADIGDIPPDAWDDDFTMWSDYSCTL